METLLRQLGLSDGEVALYLLLLERPDATPGELIKLAGLKRGDTYNKLYELKKKGLVAEFTRSKKKHFRAEDPRKLEDYVAERDRQLHALKSELEVVLPQAVSQFTLAQNRPGVSVFEGKEGLLRTLDDSLNAETEILSYVDHAAVQRYAADVNREFVAKRKRLGKQKRILVTYSEENLAHFQRWAPDVTDVRFIDYPVPSFNTVMNIYDTTVSYLTLKPNTMLGILIQDPMIAALHRGLFEYAWSTAKKPGDL